MQFVSWLNTGAVDSYGSLHKNEQITYQLLQGFGNREKTMFIRQTDFELLPFADKVASE